MQKASALQSQRSGRVSGWINGVRFEYFAGFTVLLTYGLIVLGGAVRATDSGTACPDWPLCHGRVLPSTDGHVLVEYSHRLVASIAGLLIVALALWAWRRTRDDPLVRVAATSAIVLLVAQVLVGAATVNTETDASVVAVHLSIALTLFATLVVLSLAASRPHVPLTTEPIPVLPVVVALGAFALVISGAYVSQEGAGLAYRDWPLFDGKLVTSGSWVGDLHYAHRLLAGGLGVVMAILAVRTLRNERRPAIVLAVALAVVVYVAQVFVGAANIWLELATPLRITHLALASALWAVLVFASAWAYLTPREEARA